MVFIPVESGFEASQSRQDVDLKKEKESKFKTATNNADFLDMP